LTWWEWFEMTAFSDLHDVSAGVVLDNHMSIQAAAQYSGYNLQYLRRLLRAGAIKGLKVGQVWLVKIASLDAYLEQVRALGDRRYGPRVYQADSHDQQD
jgi:excisionase family DNA binding protein